jgi:uncharacterized membrane protein YsdA (DUF1294 family)
MSPYQKIITAYVLFINALAYALMWLDKLRAKHKGRRIPENTLFAVALLLGATGIYLGMKAPLYHKAAKTTFRFGIPLLIMVNGLVTYLLMK